MLALHFSIAVLSRHQLRAYREVLPLQADLDLGETSLKKNVQGTMGEPFLGGLGFPACVDPRQLQQKLALPVGLHNSSSCLALFVGSGILWVRPHHFYLARGIGASLPGRYAKFYLGTSQDKTASPQL